MQVSSGAFTGLSFLRQPIRGRFHHRFAVFLLKGQPHGTKPGGEFQQPQESTHLLNLTSRELTQAFCYLFINFGCAGPLLLHVSYSLVVVHRLLISVASLVADHSP